MAEHLDVLVEHILAVAPNQGADSDPLLSRGLRETVAAWIDRWLLAIEEGRPPHDPVPSAIFTHIRHAASRGISLTTALHRCIAGHALAWRGVLTEVARLNLPDGTAFTLLREVSSTMSSMLACVEIEIAEAHSVEIERRLRSRAQHHTEIVRMLLSSEAVPASELVELRYDLNAWHIAVIAKGVNAEKTVRALAGVLRRELLVVPCDATTVWGWLGGEDRMAFSGLDNFRVPEDVFIAVGEPGRGTDGWRTTHHEAQGAFLVALGKPHGVTRYLDVALDATFLQDDVLADSLIEKYLSPLDQVPIGGEAARRAVRALFGTEHNVSSAANVLKVHRSSVHRWRDQIERQLGYPLHEHQAEIELALRIEALRRTRLPSEAPTTA